MAKAKGKKQGTLGGTGPGLTGFNAGKVTGDGGAAKTKANANAAAQGAKAKADAAAQGAKAKAAEMAKSFKALDNMMAGIVKSKTPAPRGGWNLAGVQFSNGIALGVNTPDVARAIAVSRKEEAAKIQAALTIKEEKKKRIK